MEPDKQAPQSKLSLGAAKEREAALWLVEAKSLNEIARNYRCRMGEIDLIFEHINADGSIELVFVEVRSRNVQDPLVSALESVDWQKRARLQRAIRHFLMYYRGEAWSMRVDIMAWDEGAGWTHIEDAYMD